jgi:hypothetical protein
MAADREDFLRRWSRRKQAAAAQGPAPKPAAESAAPELPSIDSLTFESDFKDFMHAKVEESVKRAALKKLFSDPRLNVIDYMDVYIDDYTNLESIPQEMLAKLEHARTTLFGREEDKPRSTEEPGKQEIAQAPAEEAKKKEDDGAAG